MDSGAGQDVLGRIGVAGEPGAGDDVRDPIGIDVQEGLIPRGSIVEHVDRVGATDDAVDDRIVLLGPENPGDARQALPGNGLRLMSGDAKI